MATNDILIREFDAAPAPITFADFEGDFSPTAANDLRHASVVDTEVQLSLTGVADGAGHQSDKVDLGSTRAARYNVRVAFEMAPTPVAGDVIELIWAPSQHDTPGTGNAANVSGSDSAYAGYSANLAESVFQLISIGNFVCTPQTTTTVQVGEVAVFSPTERYGSLVVKNESGAAFHSDDVECHIVFDPIVDQLQT